MWNVDFRASVDHSSGDVYLTFVRDAPYLTKITRRDEFGNDSAEIVQLLNNAGSSRKGDATTGKTRIVAPSGDLILISVGPEPTSTFCLNARGTMAPYSPISSIAAAIDRVNTFFVANGNVPFSLLIVDHGNFTPDQSVGAGQIGGVGDGKSIVGLAGGEPDVTAFINGVVDKVIDCWICGCNVARDPVGKTWLKSIAGRSDMWIRAFSGTSYCMASGEWAVSDGGKIVTITP